MKRLNPGSLDRREFLTALGSGASALALPTSWCASAGKNQPEGRLSARLGQPTLPQLKVGRQVLGRNRAGKETLLFRPESAGTRPAPFVLALHGATGFGGDAIDGFEGLAREHGIVVLAPSSEGTTWDAIRASFGSDLAAIDESLKHVFQSCAVDPDRVAIAGFSDGATYAVSLGRINGDLFTHVIAYSAGFIIPGRAIGHPQVFVSHGRNDRILPIDQCGRRVVAELRHEGYDVRFEEFDGGHTVPEEIGRQSVEWFAQSPSSPR